MKKIISVAILVIMIGCGSVFNKKPSANETQDYKGKLFDFELPNTWRAYASHGYVNYSPKEIDKYFAFAKNKFFVIKMADSSEQEDFVEKNVDALKTRHVLNVELKARPGKHSQVFELFYTNKWNDRVFKNERYFVRFRGANYMIGYDSVDTLYDKYKPDVNVMISTFEFIE